jgi:cation-transporting ATPase 13A3/4/5
MFIVFPIVLLMGSTMAKKRLGIKRPSGNLLSITNLCNLITHLIICVVFQYIVFVNTSLQSDYLELKNQHFSANIQETTSLQYLVCFQLIVMGILFSRGSPWKQSLFTNIKLIIWFLLCIFITLLIIFFPNTSLFIFDDNVYLSIHWKIQIIGYICFNIVISVIWEIFLYPYLVLKIKFLFRPIDWSHGTSLGMGLGSIDGKIKEYHTLRRQFENGWYQMEQQQIHIHDGERLNN